MTYLGRLLTLGMVCAVVAFLLLPTPKAMGTTGLMLVEADTTLSEDHFGPIVIIGDNLTLDCGGHTVWGPGFGNGIGAIGRTEITIRGCTVTSFEHGILLISTANSSLEYNDSFDNRADGIRLNSSSTNTLTANISWDNGRHGFAFSGSHNNAVADNEAASNGATGFTFESSNFNTIRKNEADNNVFDGFQLNSQSAGNALFGNLSHHSTAGHGFGLILGSAGNTLASNLTHHNAGSGFLLSEADANDLYENHSLENQSGFVLDNADSNNVAENKAHHNTDFGFLAVNTSTGNTITANDACNNGVDAADFSSGVNTWTNNNFCTSVGI